METCTGLYTTFASSVLKDLDPWLTQTERTVLANDPIEDWDVLVFIDTHGDDELARKYRMSLIQLGKLFEYSVITRSALHVWDWYNGMPLHPCLLSLFDTFFDASKYGKPLTWRRNNIAQAKRFQALRQILLAFSKVEDIEPDIDENKVVEDFVSRMSRRERYSLCTPLSHQFFYHEVVLIARALISEVLMDRGQIHPALAQWVSDPFGRHGPGAVYDGSTGLEKWRMRESVRLQKDILLGQTDLLSTVLPDDDSVSCSRLTMVPKDLTKKRLICIEPANLMFSQQGLMSVLYDIITTSLLTRGAIHLFDQSHNFYASRRKGNATIDLSDASDRLSLGLIRLLYPKRVFELLAEHRSSMIELPDGRRIVYDAAFTMGNALCFPVESLTFWAISLAAILSEELRLDTYNSVGDILHIIHNDVHKIIDRYRLLTFGDDIIIPEVYLEVVCSALQCAGLVVNTRKTCGPQTPVRESCGSFWWGDTDVRIVRFHYSTIKSTVNWISFAEERKQLYDIGLQASARALNDFISKRIPLPFDHDPVTIRAMVESGWIRWNHQLQRLESRQPILWEEVASDRLPGDVGLYAYFTGQATKPARRGEAQGFIWRWVDLNDVTVI